MKEKQLYQTSVFSDYIIPITAMRLRQSNHRGSPFSVIRPPGSHPPPHDIEESREELSVEPGFLVQQGFRMGARYIAYMIRSMYMR